MVLLKKERGNIIIDLEKVSVRIVGVLEHANPTALLTKIFNFVSNLLSPAFFLSPTLGASFYAFERWFFDLSSLHGQYNLDSPKHIRIPE